MNTEYTTIEMLPAVISVEQLAGVLQISKNSTYNIIKNGNIKSVRVGNQIRIAKGCLIEFLERAGETT